MNNPNLIKLENLFHTYLYEQAPPMPPEARQTIMRYLPWAVIFIIVLQISSIVSFFQLTSLFVALGYIYTLGWGPLGYIGIMLLVFAVIFEITALPELFKHTKKGWQFLYYAILIGMVNDILSLNILNALFVGVISLYILFQIRELYH